MLIHEISHLNKLLVRDLHKIRAIPFDVIVHLPRSGTIPASLLATYLLKPFASVEEFCRGEVNTRKAEYKTLTRILLVDDSIRTGTQMRAAVERIKKSRPDAEIFTLAVYSTLFPERVFHPTMFLHEHAETHYIYPWFMWKTKRMLHAGVDMDGVLCRDCYKSEDDDGEKYQQFLAHADLKFKTNFEIGAIITSRLEKYRPQTESWLKAHGFRYRQLIMGPWKTKDARRGNAAIWKSKIYNSLPLKLYIESNEKEARTIADYTRKPVWCVDSQEYFSWK